MTFLLVCGLLVYGLLAEGVLGDGSALYYSRWLGASAILPIATLIGELTLHQL
jgi:hypothetical protein